jgi:hypothetical protein
MEKWALGIMFTVIFSYCLVSAANMCLLSNFCLLKCVICGYKRKFLISLNAFKAKNVYEKFQARNIPSGMQKKKKKWCTGGNCQNCGMHICTYSWLSEFADKDSDFGQPAMGICVQSCHSSHINPDD